MIEPYDQWTSSSSLPILPVYREVCEQALILDVIEEIIEYQKLLNLTFQ